ncbi:lysylphosphatidylglycerol synthase transmembrane domain-containing protein [Desulfobacula sp.]|uniref:lysylphosphatidylglycerol synthase transmembrane domain-containing protein n=1 Tax=Desulfobacula sp. TaxID=2593537 RepID=UPI001EC8E336|nr:flippase-like domain-containing protein [Desulfobacula sp.]
MLTKAFLRLIGLFIFLYIICVHIDINEVVGTFVVLRWDCFILSILLIPLSIFIRSVRWKRILKKHNIDFSQWESFKMCVLGGVSSFVVPTVGSFIKVLYVKRENVGLARPIVSVLGEKYIDLILPLAFGIASYTLLYLNIINWLTLLIIFLFGFIFYVLLKLLVKMFYLIVVHNVFKKLIKRHSSVEKHLLDLESVLDFYTYLLSVMEFTVGGFVRIYLLAKAVSIDFSFITVVLVTSINSLITFIPISYFGIGTRDVGLIAVFQLFERSSEEAIALSLAILLSRIIFVFLGAAFWFIQPPPIENLSHNSPTQHIHKKETNL